MPHYTETKSILSEALLIHKFEHLLIKKGLRAKAVTLFFSSMNLLKKKYKKTTFNILLDTLFFLKNPLEIIKRAEHKRKRHKKDIKVPRPLKITRQYKKSTLLILKSLKQAKKPKLKFSELAAKELYNFFYNTTNSIIYLNKQRHYLLLLQYKQYLHFRW